VPFACSDDAGAGYRLCTFTEIPGSKRFGLVTSNVQAVDLYCDRTQLFGQPVQAAAAPAPAPQQSAGAGPRPGGVLACRAASVRPPAALRRAAAPQCHGRGSAARARPPARCPRAGPLARLISQPSDLSAAISAINLGQQPATPGTATASGTLMRIGSGGPAGIAESAPLPQVRRAAPRCAAPGSRPRGAGGGVSGGPAAPPAVLAQQRHRRLTAPPPPRRWSPPRRRRPPRRRPPPTRPRRPRPRPWPLAPRPPRSPPRVRGLPACLPACLPGCAIACLSRPGRRLALLARAGPAVPARSVS
jgi:hypothetical protein